jgi:Na+/H+ antiporter NhaD/arsenite permease-like protein
MAQPVSEMVPDAARLLGETLSPLWVTPFASLLLAIAILPLTAPHWWEKLSHRGLVAGLAALPVAVFILRVAPGELLAVGLEYAAFMSLLGSLFVISGGILLTGDLRATPLVNSAFLLAGTLLANLIGTTGASMLLIRPLLRTNSERSQTGHIPIFFIFLVGNIGGCLTPLGDPPLFLGFLEGVPFFWTLRLLPEWLFMAGLVLLVFFLVDSRMVRRETRRALHLDRERIEPLRLQGAHNFAFLVGIILSVLLVPESLALLRIGIMLALAGASYLTTSRRIHQGNRFGLFPINEVAILFAGIFVTMIPALFILKARGATFGIDKPWQFFWLTGALSSFLDNAPTYLTFSHMALAAKGITGAAHAPMAALADHKTGAELLRAVSLGAVFMGAMTYVGNGPNFMVKSIAESNGVRMPSFFGYMLWSMAVLAPLFLLVTLIFLI